MPRVLVTGDHSLIRTALKTLIASVGGVVVVGECPNEAAAIAASIARLRPTVVLMDLDLDARLAPDALAALLQGTCGCAVLVVTAYEHRRALTAALQHGVVGVVMKDRPAEVLMRALKAVASGETWLERSIVVNIVQPGHGTHDDVECGTSVVHEKLTRREAEIASLVSLGLQNKKIAERLFISETTVRHHLTSIYDKLAVTNRLELMRYAYNEGAAAG